MPREGLSLTKKERVLRSIDGQEIDKRPFTFWHPFGVAHMKSESLVAAALTFAATYGVDLLRMPTVRDFPLPAQTSLDRPHDLTSIEALSGRAGFWSERLEALRSIVRLAESKIAVFESLSDPLTTLSYLVPPEVMTLAERTHPSFLDKGLATIVESQKAYLKHVLGEAKIDGLVIEVASATFESREAQDFTEIVKPHLKALLDDIRANSDVPIWLQIAGKRIYLEPFLDLPHDLLSWSHLGHGPTLEKLPRNYRGSVAGGLDELRLESMSYQDIRRHVDEARNTTVALLCPGDKLGGDFAPSKLEGLANFLMKRDRLPEKTEAGAPRGPRPEPIIDEP